MRIRSQVILNMLLFGFVLLAVSVTALIINRQVDRASVQEQLSENIAQGASELSYLADNYLVYGESQQLERWQTRYNAFTSQMSMLDVNDADQQALARNLQVNAITLKNVFDDVVKLMETSGQNTGNLDTAFLQISWSRIAVQTQGLVSDATRLAQLLDKQTHQLQTTNTIIIGMLITCFAAYFFFNFLVIQRRILSGISRLQVGASIIGSGNLDYKIADQKRDEIGDLAHAFNKMTADLKAVTASKADLEKEIDERKRAEEALRESEEKYRSLFNTMSEGFALHEIILDEQGKPYNYRFLELNDSFERLTGLDRNKTTGKTVREIIPDVEPQWIENYGKVALTGEPIRFENYSAPLGRWYEVYSFSPRKYQFAVIFVDVTERKNADKEITHLASFPDLNPNPVIELDQQGAVSYANPATLSIFPDLIQKGYQHPFLKDLTEQVQRGETKTTVRDLYLEGIWFEQVFTFVPSSNSYRIYGRDITKRMQAEEELRRSNTELETTNKELSAFSYSVSHDLRAPLRSMEGFSDALMEDYADKLDEQGRKYLGYIKESSDQMGRIIDALLKLSRVTRSDMNIDNVNLTELAQKIAAELEKANPRSNVTFKIQAGIQVKGDRNLLRLVMENLLSNAWKFTGKTAAPVIEVGTIYNDGTQAYYVKDNGAGFDMAYADKLFTPFQRLHKTADFPGTGIGLATVQRVIHRHGGKVWAESKPGEGTTIYFTLG